MAWARSKIASALSGAVLSSAVVAQSGRCALRGIHAVSRVALPLIQHSPAQLGAITPLLQASFESTFAVDML